MGQSVQDSQSPEPVTVEEAIDCLEKNKWKEAMKQEIASLESNDVYQLVEIPKGKKPVGSLRERSTHMVLWRDIKPDW